MTTDKRTRDDPDPERSLHRKLAQVMYEAERIPKNGTAPREMGGYKFVQVGDAADFIRKALAEKVITMMPTSVQVVAQHEGTTKAGAPIMTVDLITEWTLTDGESGESITIMSYGAGSDLGDKYSGKASTSAMKYALLTGFLLSTGEDTEGDNVPERRPRTHTGHRDGNPGAATRNGATTDTTHRDGLVGKAVTQGTQDGALRQGPDGPSLPFRIKEGRLSQIVVASGDIADALDKLRADWLDRRVTVWGRYSDESFDKRDKDTGRVETIAFKVLHLERIQSSEWTLPAPPTDNLATGHEHRDDPIEAEAESMMLPLDEDERSAIAGGLPA